MLIMINVNFYKFVTSCRKSDNTIVQFVTLYDFDL